MALQANQLEQALRSTGSQLSRDGLTDVVRLYVIGGSAGLLSGLLPSHRTTGDVDVGTVDPQEHWGRVCDAAREVAKKMSLPGQWLNDRCQMYGWCLPLGWRERCEPMNRYGPLEVFAIERRDFIAAKVISAPKRPQDLEDLRDLSPTAEELAFAEENVCRVEQEHPDVDASFDDVRGILEYLRTEL